MKIRIIVIGWVISVALAYSLAGCASHPKPVKTTPGTTAQAAGKGTPGSPGGRETGKPAQPNGLPVVEKVDITGEVQAEKNGDTDKEASALLEEGFAAYQEALGAIDRKDLDTALAKLDEAYETLPKIKLGPRLPPSPGKKRPPDPDRPEDPAGLRLEPADQRSQDEDSLLGQ